MRQSERTMAVLLARNNTQSITKLDTDGNILFGLLALIVDINYRVRYGSTVANETASGYHDDIQLNNVVADQILPVDNGLLRH